MQYDLQKLERMSLDEVREVAESMGLHPRRSQSIREISYAILDAQADHRAAVVEAREAEKGTKRERTRGVKRTAKKISTANMKSEQVVATVGSEKEQLAEMQEQLKANNHKPYKTVQRNYDWTKTEPVPTLFEEPAAEPVAAVETPVAEMPAETPAPKKRGRKKKEENVESQESKVESQETKVESQETKVENPKAKAKQEEEDFQLPSLGENVIALGTLECAPDGYGFLRSADYN